MFESPEELDRLQQLLDESAASAGDHMREIITEERRLSAMQLTDRLQGMVLLVAATVTADGRPLVGPMDGCFLHGSFYFSSSRDSVRMRHLRRRAGISATHLPSEQLAVTVHGTAELFELNDPDCLDLRRAMLAHYLPLQGPDFEDWLDDMDVLAARIEAHKLFTFHMAES
jgi:hypothetical protein